MSATSTTALVVSTLDFTGMYSRVGVSRDRDILAEVASWPAERQVAAHAIIAEVEAAALASMRLTDGAAALGDWCEARGVRLGLVTRNTTSTVQHFHERHWAPRPAFLPALSRDAGLEHKPSPAALLHCAASWGVDPSDCVMVGDSARDDVVAGRRAGMTTVYVNAAWGRDGGAAAKLEGEREPHHTLESLSELPALLERIFALPAAPAE